jgi:Spy/CpxP family protein refolding chaperone
MRTTLMVAALALCAAVAVAQPAAPYGQGKMPMGMPGMMDTPKMPEMTAEQWAKMDAARTSYLRMAGPIQTDIAVKKLELAALWRAENIDSKKILAKVAEISAARTKLDAAKADRMIAMFNTLTPDQRKSMRWGMHGMMQRGMMPGMMMQGCPMMGSGMMGGGMMGGMSGSMMGNNTMDPDQMMTESESE